jgi:MFS family permease
MLLPELPDYLTSLGGADYKGYILALFTLTAGISRPFSGKLTDTIGRVPIMVFGSLVCVVCSALYPFLTTVTGFLMLRLFHGFSTGFKPTATAAFVSDVVGFERRGEAMSVLGMSGSLGMSLAPVLGSSITEGLGINTMFAVSSVFALLSVVILIKNMEETLPRTQKFRPELLKVSRKELFEPKELTVFWVQLLVSFAYGSILNLVPDLSKHLGVTNKGTYYTVFTVSSLIIRFFASKTSDIYGRVPVLKFSAFSVMISMLLLTFTDSYWMFMLSAVIYGFGWGMNTPTLQAWTVDLVPADQRGRGLATMFIALEAGIGLGSWVSQEIYRNQLERIALPYYLSAVLCFVAFLYLFTQKK